MRPLFERFELSLFCLYCIFAAWVSPRVTKRMMRDFHHDQGNNKNA